MSFQTFYSSFKDVLPSFIVHSLFHSWIQFLWQSCFHVHSPLLLNSIQGSKIFRYKVAQRSRIQINLTLDHIRSGLLIEFEVIYISKIIHWIRNDSCDASFPELCNFSNNEVESNNVSLGHMEVILFLDKVLWSPPQP